MYSISGIINFKKNLLNYEAYNRLLVRDMAQASSYNSDTASEEWVGEHSAFSVSNISAEKPVSIIKPTKKTVSGYEFAITYSGTLHNSKDIKKELVKCGYVFTENSDSEIILYAYIHHGEKCTELFKGAYAFAVWDSMRQQVFLCRDRFGIKPLFYAVCGDTLIFSSKIKSIFRYPNLKPKIDKAGISEIFAMSPQKICGTGIFKGISILKPANSMIINRNGIFIKCYWKPEYRIHKHSCTETSDKLHELFHDAVKPCLNSENSASIIMSDDPCTQIFSEIFAKENKLPNLYYDYDLEPEHFAEHIFTAMHSNDLPLMTDYDYRLLRLCPKTDNTSAILSGEYADDIFSTDKFNLTDKSPSQIRVLKPSVAQTLDLDEYCKMRYEELIAEIPHFSAENDKERHFKENLYLYATLYLPNLLNSADKTAELCGYTVFSPLSNHKLTEYLINIPWEMRNNKALDFLSKIRHKPHNHYYEYSVRLLLSDILSNPNSPILIFADVQNIKEILNLCRNTPLPQYIKNLIPINYWLDEFKPYII